MADLNSFSFGKTKRDEIHKSYPSGLDEILYELCELIDKEELTEENKDYYIKMYSDKLRDLQSTQGQDRVEYFRKIFEIFQAEDKEKQPLPKPYMTNDA